MTVYYAFSDGQVAGWISCRWDLDEGDLSTVGGHVDDVTEPQFRRQGVRSAFLAHACDRYGEIGINCFIITAVEQKERLARYWINLLG